MGLVVDHCLNFANTLILKVRNLWAIFHTISIDLIMLGISILMVIGPGSDWDVCRIVSFDEHFSTVVVLGLLSFDFILHQVALYPDFTIVMVGSVSSISLTIFFSELLYDFAILLKYFDCPLLFALTNWRVFSTSPVG
jgi:hypothetical protein